MKLICPLLVVKDMELSKRFYRDVLDLEVEMDFGANVTLTGGLSLQSEESWRQFIHVKEDEIAYGGKDAELYFETEDVAAFAEKLKAMESIVYVHPLFEHRWGQRCVRLYDPDGHVIEVGESLEKVGKRFFCTGHG